MQIFLLICTFVFLALLFVQSFVKLSNDQKDSPVELTLEEWFKHTLVEMVFNLLLFIALCLKLDINAITKAASTVSDSVGTFTEVTSIAGAMATAALIYKTVQWTFLPAWNALFGAITARKLFREKLSTK